MDDKYILVGRDVVKADLMEWANWFEKAGDVRRIAKTEIGDVTVSTVFLGLDHSYDGGPPMIFETMVFGGPFDQWQDLCSTYDQAEAMHEKAVAFCKEGVGP